MSAKPRHLLVAQSDSEPALGDGARISSLASVCGAKTDTLAVRAEAKPASIDFGRVLELDTRRVGRAIHLRPVRCAGAGLVRWRCEGLPPAQAQRLARTE